MAKRLKKHSLLGDYNFHLTEFSELEKKLAELSTPAFKKQSIIDRYKAINERLLSLILSKEEMPFLLGALNHAITAINQHKLLPYRMHLAQFEFWLVHYARLSHNEQLIIRGRIAGRFIPREDYQCYFPIGMGKNYPGSHTVVAHLSPDVDTTIASFWGWLDAFSARVGTSMHHWSLPGGPPDSPPLSVFHEYFGPDFFKNLAKFSGVLTLSAFDIVSKKDFVIEKSGTLTTKLQLKNDQKAVILVDEQDNYIGDWTSLDSEKIKQVNFLFNECLRWIENEFHLNLISFLSKDHVSHADVHDFFHHLFDVHLKDIPPLLEADPSVTEHINQLFIKVLRLPQGIKSTVSEFAVGLSHRSSKMLLEFLIDIAKLPESHLFNHHGHLIADRTTIFSYIKSVFSKLDQAITALREFIERLDIVMEIKYQVLNAPYTMVSVTSDIDDIRAKIENLPYVTVTTNKEKGKFYPVGVIWAQDLKNSILGTVTMRDFCNLNEVKMASYLSVISVIDHHKSSLNTIETPMALIGDVQSCNVLIAEQALKLNQKYSLAGMTKESIARQIKKLQSNELTQTSNRLLQRLLQRKNILEHPHSSFYVNPQREYLEYLCYIHAILDDTDLLTKVSNKDVECAANLLNQLKTLQLQEETEVLNLDDIPRDALFAKKSAQRILQNDEMYSLYKKNYALRQKELEELFLLDSEKDYIGIFSDTKEQNRCCRVGQTKRFQENVPLFDQNASELKSYWVHKAAQISAAHPEIDLHLQMISTIANADEVYRGQIGPYTHKDELWFWIPSEGRGLHHLIAFLHQFQRAPQLVDNELEVELPLNQPAIRLIFEENLPQAKIKNNNLTTDRQPTAILRFNAGSLNSRKAMISPYLPQLLS